MRKDNSRCYKIPKILSLLCLFIALCALIIGFYGCSKPQPVSSKPDLNQALSSISSTETYSPSSPNSVLPDASSTKEESSISAPEESVSTESTINRGTNLNTQAYEKILIPAFVSGITGLSWKSAEEALPDQLVAFYVLDFMEKQYPKGWDGIKKIPAKDVEDEIQKHFDVSTEHLRQAEAYSKDKNIYSVGYGFGGGADFYVTKAYQKSSFTYVEFEYKNVDVVIRKGTIILDTTGDDCKYISCESEEVN